MNAKGSLSSVIFIEEFLRLSAKPADHIFEQGCLNNAALAPQYLTVFKKDQSGYALYAIGSSSGGAFIHVHLNNNGFIANF